MADIELRVLWTTTGMCQPIVSIAVKSEMEDTERQAILHDVAEAIAAGRKRQKDTVEETLGRNCEDHITVTCNAFHFAKASKDGAPSPPAMIKWLLKTLPTSDIFPLGRLTILVVWMRPGTRELIECR